MIGWGTELIKDFVQYSIYLADLDPTVGGEIKKTRPVVIVSKNDMNRYADTIVVCPLTTSIHEGWRSRIPVRCQGRDSEIAMDQIRTVSKKRLIKRLTRITEDQAEQIRMLVTEMYGEISS